MTKPHYVSEIENKLRDGIDLLDYLKTFNHEPNADIYLDSAQEYMDRLLTKLEKFHE